MRTAPGEYRSLQLDPALVRRVIDQLDGDSCGASKGAELRRDTRYPYRLRALSTEFGDPIGGWTKHSLPSRNLSRSGCALLTGAYFYPGTACRILLITLQNLVQRVSGRVVRCRYLAGTGRIYETGVKFDEAIDMSWFCRGMTSHRALLVEPDGAANSIARMLDELNCDVTRVSECARARDQAAAHDFDATIIDFDGLSADAHRCVIDLRAAGYSRPIAAVMNLVDEAKRRNYVAAGVSSIFLRPLEKGPFAEGIASLLELPIVSSRSGDPAVAPLLNDLIASLPARICKLEAAFAARRGFAIEQAARELKDAAGGTGLPSLERAAQSLELACQMHADESQLHQALCEVSRICRAIRPATDPGQKKPALPLNVLFSKRAPANPS